MRVIFSAIQPTGIPHIGNYLGAIRPWVSMIRQRGETSSTDKFIFCIADMHAWTNKLTKTSTTRMAANNRFTPTTTTTTNDDVYDDETFEMASILLACGLDPCSGNGVGDDRVILFRQSDVALHSMFMWYLSCLTPVSRLSKMTQWKAKKNDLSNNLGLFTYPVLQAADILLYQATDVPVGEDQCQHLELCRDLARQINHLQGDKDLILPEPRTLLSSQNQVLGTERIKSLRNPLKKMSKSDVNSDSTLFLIDDQVAIRRKIARAVTDSLPSISYDEKNRPGLSNLLSIYTAIYDDHKNNNYSNKPTASINIDPIQMANRLAADGVQKSDFKNSISDLLVDHLSPIRESFLHHQSHGDRVRRTLEYGASVANQIAQNTWNRVTMTKQRNRSFGQ